MSTAEIIPDQLPIWARKHAAGEHELTRGNHSMLAEQLVSNLPKHATVLELGCGAGGDAGYFAEQGLTVLATDFSETIINKNKEFFSHQSLRFETVDMQQPLPYRNDTFEAVYAYLSLHYYTDELTFKIFAEINRVLKPNGLLAFSCKSNDSVRMENATIVAEDVYVDKKGHALHVFTTTYVRGLTGGLFSVVMLEEKVQDYLGRNSTQVNFIGKRLVRMATI